MYKGDEEMATIVEQWVHMVGIAGAGMSGIAKVLCEQGIKVSGSDLQSNDITRQLEELGVEIYQGHSSSNLKEGVDLLVVSSAIPQDNTEVQIAHNRKIPVMKRGQLLANIANDRKELAVAGAHGKTTTTSMLFMVLAECGVDPSFIVGGEIQGTQLNARLGKGDYFVIEADESDASFLELKPYVGIVTNIENDHLDFYKSEEKIHKAFKQFIEQVRPGGFAVIYGRDKILQKIKKDTQSKTITYGENNNYDYYMSGWKVKGMGSVFDIYYKEEYLGEIEMSVPGKHNALNALATIATALELGMKFKDIKKAIIKFSGTKRRFQLLGKDRDITVIDDYAHHPTEIRATVKAAREIHAGRIIVVFQPHRYSRTRILADQFGESFVDADLVIISDVYSAGEKAEQGVSGELVYLAAKKSGVDVKYIPDMQDIKDKLAEEIREGDLIITMGAGDIWKVGMAIAERISNPIPQV